jgi:membrane-bound lytic murein transglycosylase B
VLAALVIAILVAPSPARATSPASPADVVARRVTALTREYTLRSAAAAAAAARLAAGFSALEQAEGGERDADDALARAEATATERVRALYLDGAGASGALGLLTAGSVDDVLWRLSVGARIGDQLLGDDADAARSARSSAGRAGAGADSAREAADRLGRVLADLREQELAAQQALEQATAELARLTAQERARRSAQQAAAALAQAQAAAASTRLTAGPVGALGIPVAYERAYRQAAAGCPGMDWTLLAGVGQVETGHGRNNGPSSAGAIGPMQFMPATFAAYAVDGDGDGVTDAWDPEDAIFSAARYLCEGGAGQGPDGVHRAVLRYNHAEWYVDLVLAAQSAIRARTGTTRP